MVPTGQVEEDDDLVLEHRCAERLSLARDKAVPCRTRSHPIFISTEVRAADRREISLASDCNYIFLDRRFLTHKGIRNVNSVGARMHATPKN